MKTFIVNRNTPDLAENQKWQIELMSKRIPCLNNEIIIYNCEEEPFQGKLVGHYRALEEHRDKTCAYYWFNHPDLSFAVDMDCLSKLLNIMDKNPEIAVISPIQNSNYPNMYKEGYTWHSVAVCDYLSLLIRGSVIEKIGFLNLVFKYCWGAIHEYSYKVYKNGWCIAYCDITKMHHFGGTTYGKEGTINRDAYIKNAKDFASKYFVENYGEKWDKKFAKILPKGVLNTFSIHRKFWEGETTPKRTISTKIFDRLEKYIRSIKQHIPSVQKYIYRLKIKDKEGTIKIHLGCGHEKRKGWINIDIDKEVNPDIVADAKDLNIFADRSVSEIECCHLLEHLTYPEAVNSLEEWYRILKQGGILHLELPNLERCVEILYKKESPDAEQFAMVGLYGWTPAIAKGEVYQIHKYGWTPKTLSYELKKIGFREIREVSITQTWREATRYNRDMRLECVR